MLSIIISSYQPEYYDRLIKNIDETIGHDFKYEIIKIWNPGLMSITKAYNKGGEQAKFNNLLFIHEDILFRTENWGEKLIAQLQEDTTGVIGIAGSDYVPKAPSGWYVPEKKYNFSYCIQNDKSGNNPDFQNSAPQSRNPVFAVDGVFLGMKKEVFEKVKFNEKVSGYHGYDLDFSLRTAQHYKNFVINDILLEHFSKGNPDKQWLENNILIKKTIQYNYNKKKDRNLEKEIFINFLRTYFPAKKISRRTFTESLIFLPKMLNLKEYWEIFKVYYYYIRYYKSYNDKFTK